MQEAELRIYKDVQHYEATQAMFLEILADYNDLHTKMNLVLFDDVLSENGFILA